MLRLARQIIIFYLCLIALLWVAHAMYLHYYP